MTSSSPGWPAKIDFGHHRPVMPDHGWEVLAELRSKCPVAHPESDGGYWLISGHDQLQAAARDDALFSSANDLGKKPGIALPAMSANAGIIEADRSCDRFRTIGVINGWISMPASFTPGGPVGAQLP